MLVLSREKDQSIVIDECLCTVTKLTPDQVTLKFSVDGKEDQVVKRKKNESIRLDDIEVTIVVVEIRKMGTGALKVRLGVEAPREVPVHRKEVFDALNRES